MIWYHIIEPLFCFYIWYHIFIIIKKNHQLLWLCLWAFTIAWNIQKSYDLKIYGHINHNRKNRNDFQTWTGLNQYNFCTTWWSRQSQILTPPKNETINGHKTLQRSSHLWSGQSQIREKRYWKTPKRHPKMTKTLEKEKSHLFLYLGRTAT